MAWKKQRKGIDDLIGESLEAAPTETPERTTEGIIQPERKPQRTKRTGIINTSLYLPKPVLRQIKELAVTEDVKSHDLYLEGIDMLFKHRGLPSISELTKS